MKNNNDSGMDLLTSVKNKVKLNPNFMTGLIEAEEFFSITKNNRAKYKMSIGLSFIITMLINETTLLNMLKDFSGCGHIYIYDKYCTMTFCIRDIYSINNIVMPHFSNYPLRGTKYLYYLTFKKALGIINSKKYYTKEGIDEIIMSINMNYYRKVPTKYSPIHAIKENVEYIPIKGHYVNGFIAGDDCLALSIINTNFGRMSLQISQHKNNELLLLSIANYFKSPSKVYYHDNDSIQLTLSGIKLWQTLIFNHFNVYPLDRTKLIRLNKLFTIKDLMLDNNHLIQVNRFRQWKPEIKSKIINIWNS